MKKGLIIFSLSLLIFASCNESGKKTEEEQKLPEATEVVEDQAETTQEVVAIDTVSSDTLKLAFVCPPCGCSMDDSTFTSSGTCPACHMDLSKK